MMNSEMTCRTNVADGRGDDGY